MGPFHTKLALLSSCRSCSFFLPSLLSFFSIPCNFLLTLLLIIILLSIITVASHTQGAHMARLQTLSPFPFLGPCVALRVCLHTGSARSAIEGNHNQQRRAAEQQHNNQARSVHGGRKEDSGASQLSVTVKNENRANWNKNKKGNRGM